MNIVREQRGENNSLIRVTVGEADYGQEVEKSLREYKRKANIPGFRPGMVPMGIVKKMYGSPTVRLRTPFSNISRRRASTIWAT